MAENKWNDKLRRRMADFEQAPPEGLWESVQAGLANTRSAAFPWWWMLAGAAAAVLAVLVLVRPGGDPSLNRQQTAEAEVTDTLPQPLDSMSTEPVVLQQFEEAAAPSLAKLVKALPASVAPSGNVQNVAEIQNVEELQKAEAVEDVPREPAPTEEEVQPKRVQTDDNRQEAPVDILQPAAPRPLIAGVPSRGKAKLSIVATGIPGGGLSNALTEYGMPEPPRMASAPRSLTSVLSRNRSTLTQSDYRVLYRVGIMANIPITQRWSVESGLQLSHLAGTIKSSTGNMSTEINNNLYYIGIPLYAVFTPWEGRHLGVYVSAGPMAELGVRMAGTTIETIGNAVKKIPDSSFPGDWVWSLGANAGLQWKLGGFGALFVQPGVSWHIPSAKSPDSYYTEHPVALNLAGGFRILF